MDAFPLLDLSNDLLLMVLRRSEAGSLFSLSDTNGRLRRLATRVLKERMAYWGAEVDRSWDHRETAQAYLWRFGQPNLIYASSPKPGVACALTSRGVCLLGGGDADSIMLEEPFQSDSRQGQSPSSRHSWTIPGLSGPVRQSDLQIFRHGGKEYAMVGRPQVQIVPLDGSDPIDLGPAAAVTVDRCRGATQLARLVQEEEGWLLERCQLADLVAGNEYWTEAQVPAEDLEQGEQGQLLLEWLPGRILILRRDWPQMPQLRHMGAVHLVSMQWERFDQTQRDWYVPSIGSSLQGRLFGPPDRGATSSAVVQEVAVRGRLQGQFVTTSQDGLGRMWSFAFFCASHINREPVPLRTFLPMGPVRRFQSFSATMFGRFPIVYSLFERCANEQKLLSAAWRLTPPSGAWAALELGRNLFPVDQPTDRDGWGEHVLERAVRVKVPNHVLRQLLLQTWNVEEAAKEEARAALRAMLQCAIQLDRVQAVALFLEEFNFSVLCEPDEREPEREVWRLYAQACSYGAIGCAELLLQSGPAEQMPALEAEIARSEDLIRFTTWGAGHGILCAIDGQQWRIIPRLTRQVVRRAGVDSVPFYRFVLGFVYTRGQPSDEQAPLVHQFLLTLVEVEPQLLKCGELAVAAGRYGFADILKEVGVEVSPDLHLHNWDDQEAYASPSLFLKMILELMDSSNRERLILFAQWTIQHERDADIVTHLVAWLRNRLSVGLMGQILGDAREMKKRRTGNRD